MASENRVSRAIYSSERDDTVLQKLSFFKREETSRQYRNEWKYRCNNQELALLEARLNSILSTDKHSGVSGGYSVRSLYFDDYANISAHQNQAGIPDRFKWRVRYYGGGTSKHMHLEFKRKRDGRGIKKSCRITEEEFQHILNGRPEKVLWNTDETLLRRFCYEIMTRDFRPKVIIGYDRIAYTEPIANIRITLDKNISASYEFNKFLTGDYLKFPLQDANNHILEVKFDNILPGYIRNIIDSYGMQQTSFSKYYFGRKKLEGLI
ncbi:MAG: polyphosphate polymerase domain-containing protein [Candidatus Saccharibacteria bacterium]|nr:polyphosphate polymerase domain-containing protein [Candidatus Saccharibacteria bacterium]